MQKINNIIISASMCIILIGMVMIISAVMLAGSGSFINNFLKAFTNYPLLSIPGHALVLANAYMLTVFEKHRQD